MFKRHTSFLSLSMRASASGIRFSGTLDASSIRCDNIKLRQMRTLLNLGSLQAQIIELSQHNFGFLARLQFRLHCALQVVLR